jgi:Sulfotransferase family
LAEVRVLKLPNFFLAGPPKAGTTSLHHYLRQHPRVYMSPIKEPTFFAVADLRSRDDFLPTVERERGALRAYLDGPQVRPAQYWVTEWDDYVAMFRNAKDQTAIGEASVSYFWQPSAAAAIRAKVPGARLIFVLRDPADRIVPWYMMSLRREPRLTFRAWLNRTMQGGDQRGPAIDAGLFATHLQRFFDIFPREQVRVYLYESLRTDAQAVLRDILAFLGVDPDQPIDVSYRHNESVLPRLPALDGLRRKIIGNASVISWLPAPMRRALRQVYNRGRDQLPMSVDDRRMLIDYYRDEIVRTADLIGRDLSAWLR